MFFPGPLARPGIIKLMILFLQEWIVDCPYVYAIDCLIRIKKYYHFYMSCLSIKKYEVTAYNYKLALKFFNELL